MERSFQTSDLREPISRPTILVSKIGGPKDQFLSFLLGELHSNLTGCLTEDLFLSVTGQYVAGGIQLYSFLSIADRGLSR